MMPQEENVKLSISREQRDRCHIGPLEMPPFQMLKQEAIRINYDKFTNGVFHSQQKYLQSAVSLKKKKKKTKPIIKQNGRMQNEI